MATETAAAAAVATTGAAATTTPGAAATATTPKPSSRSRLYLEPVESAVLRPRRLPIEDEEGEHVGAIQAEN